MIILFATVLISLLQMDFVAAGEIKGEAGGACKSEIGLASYYGSELQGEPMANGKPFDKNDPTIAAHKGCPLGTKLFVTDLETGVSIEMTVQDHGPNVEGRDIDVSEAAAKEFVGFKRKGKKKLLIMVARYP